MKEIQLLANAIVIQALEDYKNALSGEIYRTSGCQKNPIKANDIKEECERFFRSDWCYMITRLDGDVIIDNAKRQHRQLQLFYKRGLDALKTSETGKAKFECPVCGNKNAVAKVKKIRKYVYALYSCQNCKTSRRKQIQIKE